MKYANLVNFTPDSKNLWNLWLSWCDAVTADATKKRGVAFVKFADF
jgi:hypothetical protein